MPALTDAMKEQRSYNYALEAITRARHDVLFEKIKQKNYKSAEESAKHAKPLILKDIQDEIQIFEMMLTNEDNDSTFLESVKDRMAALRIMYKYISQE